MENHQIVVPNDVWQWAQEQTGQKRPATFLRNILWRNMVETKDSEQIKVDLDEPEQYCTTDSTMPERWKAIGLMRSDPMDDFFTKAMNWLVSRYSSELEALEACENKHPHGYNSEPIANMRGFIVDLYKKHLALGVSQ